MKDNIEFEARVKKIELFEDTIHIIILPKGSLKKYGELCEIEEGKKIKVSISVLDD